MRGRPHRLDDVSETPVPETPVPKTPVTSSLLAATDGRRLPRDPAKPYRKPIHYWDIYVDDFLGCVQGNQWRRRAVKRSLLHSLDRIFRPPEPGDTPFRQEPTSLRKMGKGDATWATSKNILGWVVNTVDKTISLPEHRITRLHAILDIPTTQRFVPAKQWHQVLGELRSMSLAILGSRGLFSILQEAFPHTEKGCARLRLTSTLHGFLEDFRQLATEIAARPTRRSTRKEGLEDNRQWGGR